MGRKVTLTPAKPKLRNYISIVIDSSSSMSHLKNPVRLAYQGLAQQIRQKALEEDQETFVSVYSFADTVHTMFMDVKAAKLPMSIDYSPYGNTALYDAVGRAIRDAEGQLDSYKPHVSFLVITITDGEENRSVEYGLQHLKRRMDEVQATDRWTLTFQVPPGTKTRFCRDKGIPTGNVIEWEATTKGVEEVVMQANATGLNNYYTSRAAGIKSMTTFYVATDLSGLDIKDVKTQLDDVQTRFTSASVPREMEIREFVENEIGQTYRIGAAFYQLTKTEKVQPGKQILIAEKGKRSVYAGTQARDLIGLPHGGDAKVTPGNHANWDIFIQSTSTNRKLVRGTRVLVQKVGF